MSSRDRLVSFIEEKVKDLGKELNGELSDQTSLIKSGLFDSLALLQLALWIEEEIGSQVELTGFDLSKEWETIPDILNFIDKQRSGRPS